MKLNKYNELVDTSKFNVYLNLVSYLQSIQKSLAAGYVYYVTGEIPIETASLVTTKLDRYYRISESPTDRSRRHKLNQPTVLIKFYGYHRWHKIQFILMARPGINGSLNDLFFEREKYKNAIDRGLIIDDYCFRRVNKSAYSFERHGEKVDVKGMNSVWTLGLNQNKFLDKFRNALIRRNWYEVKNIGADLSLALPFYGVRQDGYHLGKKMAQMYNRMAAADPSIQPKRLNNLFTFLDNKRYYLRQQKAEKQNLQEFTTQLYASWFKNWGTTNSVEDEN